jgi:hypothetical protein
VESLFTPCHTEKSRPFLLTSQLQSCLWETATACEQLHHVQLSSLSPGENNPGQTEPPHFPSKTEKHKQRTVIWHWKWRWGWNANLPGEWGSGKEPNSQHWTLSDLMLVKLQTLRAGAGQQANSDGTQQRLGEA